MSLARPHRTQLHPEPPIATGKLLTPGARSQVPEGEPNKAHSCVCVSPVALTRGYRLLGAVNGVQMSLLLDTGAAVTLLREDTWARITAESPQELRPWSTLKLVSAGGTPLTIHGSARVELDLEGEKFTTIVVVSPLTSEAILGLDFLQGQQTSIDLATKTLSLKGGGRALPLRDPTYTPPPAVACALVAPTSTTVPVRLLNPLTEPVTVYAGMTLATLESVEPPPGAVDAVSSGDPEVPVGVEKQKLLWNLAEQSGRDLGPGEKDLFYHLLLSYADVIASSTADLGRTDRLRHSIHTGGVAPVWQPVRRVPPHRREEVRKLLNEMLERGVVEPSASPWASPIVLVRKKDGQVLR